LLGVCETRDPTDKDRAHLKKLVRELKQRNESMSSEVKDLERVVEQLKQGRYSEMESSKHLTGDEIRRLQMRLEETDRAREELQREN
jgi:predicted RNase H-like nuclease (RuvC/YqgF family)